MDHAHDTVFNGVETFFLGHAKFINSLVFVSKNQLVKGIGRISIGVGPARVLHVLKEALVVGHEPTTLKAAHAIIQKGLRNRRAKCPRTNCIVTIL